LKRTTATGEATESLQQQAIINWFDLQYPLLKSRLAAIPNAGKMPAWVGARFNKEGRRKGFPDLILPVQRHGFAGLFIELKTTKGKPSKEQGDWLDFLNQQGYMAVVCKGQQAAIDTITSYLNGGRK